MDLEAEKLKLVHSAKLATLGQMAAGVAHEINNPLAIISFSNILLKKSERENIKSEVTNNIDDSVKRISKIVTGLKKFCRDTSEFNRVKVQLEKIIEDSLNLVQYRAKIESIDISISHIENHNFYCDELEISQIIVNLLNNAIEANLGNPDAWIKIYSKKNNPNIDLIIQDSGKGIDSKVLENLFDPFFTTKDVNMGTGLGLSISRSIAEAHNGSLKYNLEDGHTAFILGLPESPSPS